MDLHAEYEGRCRTDSDIVDHLPFLHDTVCRHPGAAVLELGVRSGNSTAAFLAGAELVDGHVWSVDICSPRVPGWWAETGRWTLSVGDDLIYEPPGRVDVLFIDTSHAYQHTLDELERFVPHVTPGGVVLCHDTELEHPEGVTGPPFPVATALGEFCEAHSLTWSNRSGCYGLGVIEIPEED